MLTSKILLKMNNYNNISIAFFSAATAFWFVSDFIARTFGLFRRGLGHSLGPYYLNEIQWDACIVNSIICGIIITIIVYIIERKGASDIECNNQKARISIPKLHFKNLESADLFYTFMFLGFFLIFVVHEYLIRDADITFWEFCCTLVPWWKIIKTSFIFGTIITIGFEK